MGSRAWSLVPLVTMLGTAHAEEHPFDPDFIFSFQSCRTVVSSLDADMPGDGFKEVQGPTHEVACERAGKRALKCLIVFSDPDAPPVRIDMRVETDSTQLLMLTSTNGGDFIIAKPSTGRVIATSRILGDGYTANKTCRGMYMSGDEFRAMNKSAK